MRGRKASSVLFPVDYEAQVSPTPDQRPPAPPRPWPLFAVLACIAASMLAGAYIGFRERVSQGQPGFTIDLFRSLFPLVMLVVFLLFLMRSTGRGSGAGTARVEGTSAAAGRGCRRGGVFHLQRRQPERAPVGGFRAGGGVSKPFSPVPHADHLHPGPQARFPSPESVGHFRELVRRMIVERPASAFPVVPAGANHAER